MNLKFITRLLLKNPISSLFGFDRGIPIDRYYIEAFLSENRMHIKGMTIEIADNAYTKRFGERVTRSLILHVSDKGADIIGNLETGEGLPVELADCIIMTQTLSFIYDIKSAVKHSLQMLKKGGCLLVTNPGITQISRYDYDRWGQYWSFTDKTIRRLFEEHVPKENITTATYGNVKTAACFLYGMASEELVKQDLNYNDPNYQLVVAAIITK